MVGLILDDLVEPLLELLLSRLSQIHAIRHLAQLLELRFVDGGLVSETRDGPHAMSEARRVIFALRLTVV